MKHLVSIIIVGLLSFACLAESESEPVKKVDIYEVKASNFNIRVGEKLKRFGWRISNNGDKYCEYQSGLARHYINSDLFEKNKCPKEIVGVKKRGI